jgi:hypothetical protein
VCGVTGVRATHAASLSRAFTRLCRIEGQQLSLAPHYPPALVVDSPEPLLALSGILHPRVVISRSIADHLPPEELSVVLGHESAHRTSRDNLKRLCIFLSPFWLRAGAQLERAWISFAEFAADEQAAGFDERRSIALASALIRVARAGTMRHTAPVTISFLADSSDLSLRIERLLASPPRPGSVGPTAPYAIGPRMLLPVMLILMAAVFNPATFRLAQKTLEHLVR